MPERRFPPPWSVEDSGACFVVKDGQTVYEPVGSATYRPLAVNNLVMHREEKR
jgi:hypothetical protein